MASRRGGWITVHLHRMCLTAVGVAVMAAEARVTAMVTMEVRAAAVRAELVTVVATVAAVTALARAVAGRAEVTETAAAAMAAAVRAMATAAVATGVPVEASLRILSASLAEG